MLEWALNLSRTMRHGDTMKTIILAIATLFALAGMRYWPLLCRPDRSRQESSGKAAASGPTKVTGEPTKTASGLEYWDIKVGTGAVAADRTARQSRLHGLADQWQEVRQLGRHRQTVRVHAGSRPGHQGLGRRYCRHEGRWQAPAAHSARPGLRSEGLSRR